jgi:hypothetical protein
LLQLFLIPRNIPSENIDQKKEKNKQNSHNDASPKKYIIFTRNISQGKKNYVYEELLKADSEKDQT